MCFLYNISWFCIFCVEKYHEIGEKHSPKKSFYTFTKSALFDDKDCDMLFCYLAISKIYCKI